MRTSSRAVGRASTADLTRTAMKLRHGLLAIAGLAACEHSAPFQTGDYAPAPGSPLRSGALVQLTYNPGQDRMPAWLPGGTAFLYVRQRLDRPDGDSCLARMPAGGGSITGELCDILPAADDSLDVLESPGPAPLPDGEIAYVRTSTPLGLGAVAPRYEELVVGPFRDGVAPRVLRSLPFPSPGGRGVEAISDIQWIGRDSIAFLAENLVYERACSSCAATVTRWGFEVDIADLSTSPATVTTIPGTQQASSVAAHGDTIYYTLNGDSRVYLQLLGSNIALVLHDFGQIARDVQVQGSRLVAVVGGDVSFTYDSTLADSVQRDQGGPLHLLDIGTGNEVALTGGVLQFRHPALDPTGRRLVAELITPGSPPTSDIWEIGLP